jgi:hypothetical protein
MPLRGLILELIAWAPLIALLLSSLGLIVLKRISGLPPWMRRLTVPPFYFVSLSIAMLTIGMEVLVLYVIILLGIFYMYHDLFDRYHSWLTFIYMGGETLLLVPAIGAMLAWSPALGESLTDTIAFVVFIAFWAAQFVSGRLLWRTRWRDDERESPSNKTMQHLRALFILFIFAWAFLSVRNFVLGVCGLPCIRLDSAMATRNLASLERGSIT